MEAIRLLQHMGMTAYEAKAYLALVAAGSPLTGYEVAKASGVPRSTVYETLAKLVARGAAFEVHSGAHSPTYLALPAGTFLARLDRQFGEAHEFLTMTLPAVAAEPETHLVRHLRGADAVLDRARAMIDDTGRELFVSLWGEEAEQLLSSLTTAVARGVDIRLLAHGWDGTVGHTWLHRFSDPQTVLDRIGCRLLVVAADRREVLIGGARGDDVWALHSDNPAVVLLAVEYIRHDIAMQVLVEHLGDHDHEDVGWAAEPVLLRLAQGHRPAAGEP